MEPTIAWSVIGLGSTLLLVGTFGRRLGPGLRFWLELSRAATKRELVRVDESEDPSVFRENLRALTARTSQKRGPTPEGIPQCELNETTAQSVALVGQKP
jgi:hypothetical protein